MLGECLIEDLLLGSARVDLSVKESPLLQDQKEHEYRNPSFRLMRAFLMEPVLD